MRKIYKGMAAGVLALMMTLTPVCVPQAKTVAVEQTAEGERTVTYYSVSFDANKGKKVKSTLTVTGGEVYGKLPKTSRSGYRFLGWYTKKSGGKKVTAKTIFGGDDDQVLYAHWKKNVQEDQTVTENTSETAAQKPESGSAVDQPATAEKETVEPAEKKVLVSYVPNIKTDYNQNDYSSFLVLKNFKPEYLYCQYDYKRFIGSNGKNVGCTATADAMLASIYMDKPFSPNDEGWVPGVGATWTNTVIADGTKSYSVKQQCQVVYDYLQEGKPTLIRVVGHSVTAIGVRKNADRQTITPADILIADPTDAKVKRATDMGWRVMTDANGWGIRIPKASLSGK